MSITDIHIKADAPQDSIAFPGPRSITSEELPLVLALLARIEGITRPDFGIAVDGVNWRGRFDSRAIDGHWYRLRRMAAATPTLDSLPSPMPGAVHNILMSPGYHKGGLIYIAGAPGSGKTTTASATLASRLQKFGGVAYTVEDPPELPLNGWHGKGYCTQTWVAGDDSSDWAESMRGVLRSQPAATNAILYIGEVRDAETAHAMLRAASNGFLVIATGFGDNIINAVDTFLQLTGRDKAASLGAVLRAVVHQRLAGGRLTVQALTSESSSSEVGVIVSSGNLGQLQTEIDYQHQCQRMSAGGLLEAS